MHILVILTRVSACSCCQRVVGMVIRFSDGRDELNQHKYISHPVILSYFMIFNSSPHSPHIATHGIHVLENLAAQC